MTSANTFVNFEKDLFAQAPAEKHSADPWRPGEDLIVWLLARLTDLPFTFSEPLQQAYGWGFWADTDKERFWTYASVLTTMPCASVVEWGLAPLCDTGLPIGQQLNRNADLGRYQSLCAGILFA